MSHDVLSEVLRSVRLRGAVYYHINGGLDWVAEARAACDIAEIVMPGSQHVLEYHAVARGKCWGAIIGHPPVRLEAGDILIFPHGDAHAISSSPGMRAAAPHMPERPLDQLPFTLRLGIDGAGVAASDEDASVSLICGFLGCDVRPFNPLIAALPRMLHLKGDSGARDGWLVPMMQHAVFESRTKRAGGEAMLERLSEMMFVDAMRRYADTLPEGSKGWFAGLRDRMVGRALAVMHDDPSAAWTVDELGKRVGLSRSALHQRFVEMIGVPPMQYLANWRMQVAASLLRNSNATIASIALKVGYDSEAAFARAFRRLLGTPPATWRRASLRSEQGVAATVD